MKLNFSVFEQVDAETLGLYQAARQRSPIGVMLQLGQQSGQLFGAYMPAMVPEVPEFDDQETRLQWKFQNSRRRGRSMTSCMSRSGKGYDSALWFDAEAMPGVRYAIAHISFGRRIELARRIREIGRKLEFLEAGSDVREKLEAAVVGAEVDRAYLEWGLLAVEGLTIDGEPATPETLIDKGPLELATEILSRVKAECGLSEDERKN